MLAAECGDYGDVVLAQRLRAALLPKLLSGEIDGSPLAGLAEEPAQAEEVI